MNRIHRKYHALTFIVLSLIVIVFFVSEPWYLASPIESETKVSGKMTDRGSFDVVEDLVFSWGRIDAEALIMIPKESTALTDKFYLQINLQEYLEEPDLLLYQHPAGVVKVDSNAIFMGKIPPTGSIKLAIPYSSKLTGSTFLIVRNTDISLVDIGVIKKEWKE